MLVNVDTVNPPASPMASIITASGLSEDGTQRITFGGDHRPMAGLLEVVEYEGEVACEVEEWQILSVADVEPEPEPVDLNQPPMFEVVNGE